MKKFKNDEYVIVNNRYRGLVTNYDEEYKEYWVKSLNNNCVYIKCESDLILDAQYYRVKKLKRIFNGRNYE